MEKEQFAILIPVRLSSFRFPNKPLADLKGETLIERVYNRCKEFEIDTFVITEDPLDSTKIHSPILSPTFANGTERLSWAVNNIKHLEQYDYIINVQCDMPDITFDIIDKLAIKCSPYNVVTPCTEMSEADQKDSNIVKFIHNGFKGHWFCRASLGYGDHHLGVYAFSRKTLASYNELNKCPAEDFERLEQLRWIHNSVTVTPVHVEFNGIEINTQQDLDRWNETHN
jgi:3-deoxy-manno-octulosonate cytidylyltransferase (CMP-KDO synthetase)|tara:strand:+ start:140 stop:820 length:681 start_codon:yes stop_codon:yes gene_type:complete